MLNTYLLIHCVIADNKLETTIKQPAVELPLFVRIKGYMSPMLLTIHHTKHELSCNYCLAGTCSISPFA